LCTKERLTDEHGKGKGFWVGTQKVIRVRVVSFSRGKKETHFLGPSWWGKIFIGRVERGGEIHGGVGGAFMGQGRKEDGEYVGLGVNL